MEEREYLDVTGILAVEGEEENLRSNLLVGAVKMKAREQLVEEA
jgi:hypothetical protein